MNQLRRMREEPVSAEELESAKSFLIGSFPLRIETAGQIASQVAQTELLGLDTEDLIRYRENIDAVSAEDVQRVAQEYVRPDQAAIIVVGDATQILEPLRAVAPVAVLDVDGEPLDLAALEVRGASETFDVSSLEPGTLTYQIVSQGNPVGTATTTLAREGDVWVSTSSVQAGPTQQQTEVRFGEGLTPISSGQSATQGPVQTETSLRYENGRVTGTAKLPEQMGGDKTIDTEVVGGTIFDSMDQYALAVADLEAGKTITLPVFSAQAGTVVSYTVEVTGTEEVTVPAGTFQTYRLELSAGPQNMVLFVRQDLPHIMIKQEIVGQPVTVELQTIG